MLINSFISINMLLIVAFLLGQYFLKLDKPKLMAAFSIFISIILVFYLAFILIICVKSIIYKEYLNLILFPFMFVPFIIGIFANYKKINFYTNIQNLFFVLSLVIAIFLFK